MADLAVVIRRAVESDAAAMSAYMDGVIGENLDTIGRRTPVSVEEEVEFIRKAASKERAFIMLAFDGPACIGLLDLWAGENPRDRHGGRFGMSVAKEWRGQGVGRALLEAAIAGTKAWEGFCRIELEVAPWNANAIALYESLGFELEARKRKSMALRGEPEDMLLMSLVW
jgi:RimJ/RimL family protein N-acetyltransferase